VKKSPNIVTVAEVCSHVEHTHCEINGEWVPARSVGFHSIWYRIRCAWLVFTGQADALKWPKGQ